MFANALAKKNWVVRADCSLVFCETDVPGGVFSPPGTEPLNYDVALTLTGNIVIQTKVGLVQTVGF